MSLVGNILRSYRAPRQVMREQIDHGIKESQTLFIGMMFGFLNFIANTPERNMIATASGADPVASMAANFVATVFLLLLFMYLLAWAVNLGFQIITKHVDPPITRRACFWAALVTSPLVLITGLLIPFVPLVVITLLRIFTAILFGTQLYLCIKESRV